MLKGVEEEVEQHVVKENSPATITLDTMQGIEKEKPKTDERKNTKNPPAHRQTPKDGAERRAWIKMAKSKPLASVMG